MNKPLQPASIQPPKFGTACFATLLAGLMALGLPALGAEEKPNVEAPPADSKGEAAAKPGETPEETKEEAKEETKEEAEKPAEEAPAEDPAAEAAPGDFRNWFNVSVGGLIIDGDKGAAQRRFGLPGSAFGGVEEFHFEKDVSKTAIFKLDGRGIFDNEDYRLKLEYNDSDRGFVRGGVEQSRSFYDSTGGWYPGGNQWFDLFGDPFETVRGTAFFEAGLRKPGIPEFTVRYEHRYRDGMKDSTIWGDSRLTGSGVLRAFLPAAMRIDETSDVISFDVRHTVGKATFGGAFSYQHDDAENARLIWRRPGETSERKVTQTERVERDVYSARAFVDTVFNDKVRLSSAYLFTTLDTIVSGSRILGSDYDPVYDPVNARRGDPGFVNLAGVSQLDQHVWNVNLRWAPLPHLTVIPAFRIENQVMDGASTWLDTTIAPDVASAGSSSRDMLDLSQQLEVRYTGVTNVVVYARGDWVEGDGNVLEQGPSAWRGPDFRRDSDFDRFSQKYTAGAHWYPLRQVNLHAQYYRKMRDNRYDATPAALAAGPDRYPGFIEAHDFTTDDVNFRVTWRPVEKLTLTTRYDYQLSTIDLTGAGLAEQEASRRRAHILGQTLTWTPLTRLYVQPGVNYVLDTTESPASAVGGTGAVVADAVNDYVNVTCTVGLVLDDRTDLQAQYSYYLADNFDERLAANSMPYGAGSEEHGIFASVIRRISPRLRMTLRYGYFTSHSGMSGGFDDYDAHLIYTSAQYLF